MSTFGAALSCHLHDNTYMCSLDKLSAGCYARLLKNSCVMNVTFRCVHRARVAFVASNASNRKDRTMAGLTHVGTAYYVPDDVFVDVHTTDSKSRTQITHPYKGTIIVPSRYLRSFVPGTLHAN